MRSRRLVFVAVCALVLFCAGTVLADVTDLCYGSVWFAAVQGKVKGNKIPTFEGRVDIPSRDSSEAAESMAVIYSLSLIDPGGDRIGPSPATKPKKVVVTVYDGTTERGPQLAKKTVRFNPEGGFEALFEGLQPLDSYTYTAKLKGRL